MRSGVSFGGRGAFNISVEERRDLGKNMRRVQDYLDRGLMVHGRRWHDFSDGYEQLVEVFSLPVYCRVRKLDGKEAVRVDFKDRDGDLVVDYA